MNFEKALKRMKEGATLSKGTSDHKYWIRDGAFVANGTQLEQLSITHIMSKEWRYSN